MSDVHTRLSWAQRARRKFSTDQIWPDERRNPQTEPGFPQTASVSRETEQGDGAVNEIETQTVPDQAVPRPRVRTAAELAAEPATYDESTPMAREVAHQLLVRRGVPHGS